MKIPNNVKVQKEAQETKKSEEEARKGEQDVLELHITQEEVQFICEQKTPKTPLSKRPKISSEENTMTKKKRPTEISHDHSNP